MQDTCFISYSHHNCVEGLSDIGGEKGSKGIVLHSSLAIDTTKSHPEVVGLLDQHIHRRVSKVPKYETYNELQNRWRESMIWQETSNRNHMDDVHITEVMDREADVFDIMKNCTSLGHDFVIRSKNDRLLNVPNNERLSEVLKRLKTIGHVNIDVRKKPYQSPWKAKLNITFSKIEILGPKIRKNENLLCYVVHAKETRPPESQEPLEWILLTSHEVTNFEQACNILEMCKCRWIVEEYHKAIKTGCGVEKKQLHTVERLENFLGIAQT